MSSAEEHRTKRRDAVRNRERVLAAAREAFASKGPDVALEEIARLAEVSRTTLYRNFATREHLAAEVFEDNVQRIERRAEELLGTPDGVVRLFDDVLEMILQDRALIHVLSGVGLSWFVELSDRTRHAFGTLIEPARAAGTVRPDASPHDFIVALHMAGPLAENVGDGTGFVDTGRELLHRALFDRPAR